MLRYLFCLLTRCVNVVSAALPLSIFVFQIAMLLKYDSAVLSLKKTYKTGNTHPRRYLYQHMNMVGAYFCLYTFHLFPVAYFSQYFPSFHPIVFVKDFSAILRRKYYILFAVPCRMCLTIVVIRLHAFCPPFDTLVRSANRTKVSKGVFFPMER